MNWQTGAVLHYMKHRNTSPLMFKNVSESEQPDVENMTLNKLVHHCLWLTSYYVSYDAETEHYQCDSNRWRSSGDLWRHVIYYKPDVTIIDVIKVLWEDRHLFVGHYCEDVHRRVFKCAVVERGSKLYFEDCDEDDLDEYNLNFPEWATLENV